MSVCCSVVIIIIIIIIIIAIFFFSLDAVAPNCQTRYANSPAQEKKLYFIYHSWRQCEFSDMITDTRVLFLFCFFSIGCVLLFCFRFLFKLSLVSVIFGVALLRSVLFYGLKCSVLFFVYVFLVSLLVLCRVTCNWVCI